MRLNEILETIRQEINQIGQEELSLELEDIHKDLMLKQPDKVEGDLLKGEHFLFEYIGHLPEISLYIFETPEEITALMLGDRGIFNAFCTLQIPLINGKASPYIISYFNSDTQLAEQADLQKILSLREKSGFNAFQHFTNRKITWSAVDPAL
ncbi:hypothetical protein [Pedobacter caeni]|uniref:Uncharacterized protein n=1 Tax=Pedobacter caeni TaxID=288992 RepID=A0A1M5NQY1_9SPHI|nr:hypothetical protein [Pedobacter caeni]SHG92004.1 hypothetical protein SAMN04488522_108241 [Pedobacter caeni]